MTRQYSPKQLHMPVTDNLYSQACKMEGLVRMELQRLDRHQFRDDMELLCNSRNYGVEVTQSHKLRKNTRAPASESNGKNATLIKWIIKAVGSKIATNVRSLAK